jgi:hypothetical protein
MVALEQNVKTGSIKFKLKDGRIAFVYPETGYVRMVSSGGYLYQLNKRGEYLNDDGDMITCRVVGKSQRLPRLLNFLSNYEESNCLE